MALNDNNTDWKKFTSIGGGFHDVYIMDGVVDGVPDKQFEACIGTFSGGGSPIWRKEMPEFKTSVNKANAKGLEKLKIEKKLAKIRKDFDLKIHNEMRRLGYTKEEK
jgi:hypothetical protein